MEAFENSGKDQYTSNKTFKLPIKQYFKHYIYIFIYTFKGNVLAGFAFLYCIPLTQLFPDWRDANEVRIKANLKGMQMKYIYIHWQYEHMCGSDSRTEELFPLSVQYYFTAEWWHGNRKRKSIDLSLLICHCTTGKYIYISLWKAWRKLCTHSV